MRNNTETRTVKTISVQLDPKDILEAVRRTYPKFHVAVNANVFVATTSGSREQVSYNQPVVVQWEEEI